MRDFTLKIYRELLDSLQAAGYGFATFAEYLRQPEGQVALLRHDVDARKLHSLEFARIQHQRGIKGTYYFRIVPQSFDEGVMREIYDMGHEVGYHYEDMDLAKGDPQQAIGIFERNLEKLRRVAPITTICMHGSPRSKYDNKDLWKHYDYRDYDIVGEPYFDLDFNRVFYLTDTGRRWDGHKVSVRDKVAQPFDLLFHTTGQLIESLQQGKLPKQVMLNFHPQRWMDPYLPWLAEKNTQTFKNFIKYCLILWRSSK